MVPAVPSLVPSSPVGKSNLASSALGSRQSSATGVRWASVARSLQRYHEPVSVDVRDADVLTIHTAIKNSFNVANRNDIINATFVELQAAKHRARCARLANDSAGIRSARRDIRTLRRALRAAEDESGMLLYIFLSDAHLGEYKQSARAAAPCVFGVENAPSQELMQPSRGVSPTAPSHPVRRHEDDSVRNVIEKYLAAARRFAIFENYVSQTEQMKCATCSGSMFVQSTEDDSVFMCEECGTEVEFLDDAPTYRDTARVNMATKYTYTKRTHFSDALKRFQGKQKIDPKKLSTVVEFVQAQMRTHRITPSQNHRNSLTKMHVHLFLSESDGGRFTKHYDDINLIFSTITHIPCPDISHLEEDLYADFEAQEGMFEQLDCLGRRNSLSVSYKLYRLLQRRGFSCSAHDFFALRTADRKTDHDELLRKVWGALGWVWPAEPTLVSSRSSPGSFASTA